jgi:hypothetical protein
MEAGSTLTSGLAIAVSDPALATNPANAELLTQLRRWPNARLADVSDHPYQRRSSANETETEMTTALTLNIVFAGLVLIAVIGMIAWSIATQNVDAITGHVRGARRRSRATTRARLVGRTVDGRA